MAPAKRRRLSRPPQPPPPPLPFSPIARSLSAPRRRRPQNPKSQPPIPAPNPPNPKSDSDSDSDSDSESSDDDSQQGVEIVQADFGFFDPKPADFAGVKLLMQRYLDDRPWDCSGFVDLILEQTTVGTVIKSDGDDDDSGGDADGDDGPYGVVSALNLQRYASHRCIGELKKYVMDVCTDEGMRKELKVLLEEKAGDVGVLVSQRFVNCPYQLVPPLYDGLFDEISWATEDEPTKVLRDSFRFKFYALVSRIYVNKNVNQQKLRPNSKEDEPINYIKAEDEIFHELSKLSFTFRLHAEQPPPPELKSYNEMGLFMIVKADKIPEFRAKLKSLVDESQ